MATTRKTAPAQHSTIELVSGDQPLPGGMYVNTGEVDLVLLRPPAVLPPGQVIELEFGIRHRDLRPATAAEIAAAQDAEAAEESTASAADDPAPGQE